MLLWNPDGFLTETTIANIVVDIDGERFTPPVNCGLLGGTYRQWMLDQGEIRERKIHMDELPRIRGLALINSVRGETQAQLVAPDRPVAASSGV